VCRTEFDLVNDFIGSFPPAVADSVPSVMQNLRIPQYDDSSVVHRELTKLSEQAHRLVEHGKPIGSIDANVNQAVRKLWSINS
jgi:hypothetical protein